MATKSVVNKKGIVVKICAACQRDIHYDARMGWTHTYSGSRYCYGADGKRYTAWPMSADRMHELGIDFYNEHKADTNA